MANEKLEAFLDTAAEVAALSAFRAQWQAAGKKQLEATLTGSIRLDGVDVPPDVSLLVFRALSSRLRRGVAAMLLDAIADATTERDSLKAAAKAEYDPLFV